MIHTRVMLLALLVLLLSGCGGGGADIQTTTTNTTMGQELMDLNESFNKGILTEEEYNNAKETIMDRYNQ